MRTLRQTWMLCALLGCLTRVVQGNLDSLPVALALHPVDRHHPLPDQYVHQIKSKSKVKKMDSMKKLQYTPPSKGYQRSSTPTMAPTLCDEPDGGSDDEYYYYYYYVDEGDGYTKGKGKGATAEDGDDTYFVGYKGYTKGKGIYANSNSTSSKSSKVHKLKSDKKSKKRALNVNKNHDIFYHPKHKKKEKKVKKSSKQYHTRAPTCGPQSTRQPSAGLPTISPDSTPTRAPVIPPPPGTPTAAPTPAPFPSPTQPTQAPFPSLPQPTLAPVPGMSPQPTPGSPSLQPAMPVSPTGRPTRAPTARPTPLAVQPTFPPTRPPTPAPAITPVPTPPSVVTQRPTSLPVLTQSPTSPPTRQTLTPTSTPPTNPPTTSPTPAVANEVDASSFYVLYDFPDGNNPDLTDANFQQAAAVTANYINDYMIAFFDFADETNLENVQTSINEFLTDPVRIGFDVNYSFGSDSTRIPTQAQLDNLLIQAFQQPNVQALILALRGIPNNPFSTAIDASYTSEDGTVFLETRGVTGAGTVAIVAGCLLAASAAGLIITNRAKRRGSPLFGGSKADSDSHKMVAESIAEDTVSECTASVARAPSPNIRHNTMLNKIDEEEEIIFSSTNEGRRQIRGYGLFTEHMDEEGGR